MSLWNAYSSTLYGERNISKVLEKKYGMKYYKASSAMKKDNIHGFKLFLIRNKGIKLKEINEHDLDGYVREYYDYIEEIAHKTQGYEGFKNGVTYQAKFAGINITSTGVGNSGYGWGGGVATSKSQIDFFTCQFHMEGDVFVYGEQGNRVMGSFSIKNIKSIRLDNKQLNIIDEYNNRIMIRHGIISTISLQTLQEYILKLREELLENDRLICSNPALESNMDAASEIEKFFNLKEKGIISEEEFELKKKELLGLSAGVETSQNLLKDKENSIGATQSLVNSGNSFAESSLNNGENFDAHSLDNEDILDERAQDLVNAGDEFSESDHSMDIEEKIICPNCNSELNPNVKFCTQCGYKLNLKCPNCGSEIHENDKFCTSCGFKLN